MIPGAPDRFILRWLARRTSEVATDIAARCGMTPADVRAHFVTLESLPLVASRTDNDVIPPRRVYYVTAEGRRAIEISDKRKVDA